MKALEALRALNYEVKVIGNNIKLSYRGEGKPDREKVLPLIRELQANKDRFVRELQKDIWKSIWREKGELILIAHRLGRETIKLVGGREKYDPNCPYPQFILPDDWEMIEALEKVLKVFPGCRIVERKRPWEGGNWKDENRT
jgi:hypothetical protein